MFLLDQNIPPGLIRRVEHVFNNMKYAEDCGLHNATDTDIWKYAQVHQMSIITRDKDFFDLCTLRGFPPKIIWIRLGNIKTQMMAESLIAHQPQIEKFLQNPDRGILQIKNLMHIE